MLNKNKVGLLFASFFALVHAGWAALVAAGFAQPLMDWFYSLHFLNNPSMVAEFDLGGAFVLVGVAAIVGYAAGWLAAFLWNRIRI